MRPQNTSRFPRLPVNVVVQIASEIRRHIISNPGKLQHPLPIILGRDFVRERDLHHRPIQQVNPSREFDRIFLNSQCDAHARKMPEVLRGVNSLLWATKKTSFSRISSIYFCVAYLNAFSTLNRFHAEASVTPALSAQRPLAHCIAVLFSKFRHSRDVGRFIDLTEAFLLLQKLDLFSFISGCFIDWRAH